MNTAKYGCPVGSWYRYPFREVFCWPLVVAFTLACMWSVAFTLKQCQLSRFALDTERTTNKLGVGEQGKGRAAWKKEDADLTTNYEGAGPPLTVNKCWYFLHVLMQYR